jgi:microcystin-dependent protein
MMTDLSYNKILLSNSTGNISDIEFPTGMIVIWNGTKENVPRGWGLCNGTNGTPDLRGQFIRMYSDDVAVDNNKLLTDRNINKITETLPDKQKELLGISTDNKKRSIFTHKIDERGGTDLRILDLKELPAHNHEIDWGNAKSWGDADRSWQNKTSGRSPIAASGYTPNLESSMNIAYFGENRNYNGVNSLGCGDSLFQLRCGHPTYNDSWRKAGIENLPNGPHPQNNQPPYYVLSFIMKLELTDTVINNQQKTNLIIGDNNLILSNSIGRTISIGFPRGIIVIWSGTKADVPTGWGLCNGSSGTPDLRGRFVRMYSDDLDATNFSRLRQISNIPYSEEYAGVSRTSKIRAIFPHKIREIGGTDLQVSDVKEIPRHRHDIDWGDKASKWGWTGVNFRTGDGRNIILNNRGNTPRLSESYGVKINPIGNTAPQNNQPPYYVLAFIMKL